MEEGGREEGYERRAKGIQRRKVWEEEHMPALVAGVGRGGEERKRKGGSSERVRH